MEAREPSNKLLELRSSSPGLGDHGPGLMDARGFVIETVFNGPCWSKGYLFCSAPPSPFPVASLCREDLVGRASAHVLRCLTYARWVCCLLFCSAEVSGLSGHMDAPWASRKQRKNHHAMGMGSLFCLFRRTTAFAK